MESKGLSHIRLSEGTDPKAGAGCLATAIETESTLVDQPKGKELESDD
jgi:hypothetical protein